MGKPTIVFVRGEGGLGRPLAGKDYVSGLVTYIPTANLPSGFGALDRVKLVFSIAEAEALGIIQGDANSGVLWYHTDAFFKMQPKGKLYIGIYDTVAVDLSVIETVQTFANGEIRQIAVVDVTTAFLVGAIATLQTSADNLEAVDRPLSVLYTADFTGIADLSTLADLRTETAKNVSVVLGEDGNGAGAALAVSTTKSVTQIGALLGAIAFAKVNESILWVSKFNFVDSLENDVPGMANGQLVKDLSSALTDTLTDQGYIFGLKHEGIDGTFFNDSPTSIATTSDFAFIENVRTIDKAVRGIRTFMLPNLGSPVLVNADGTLTEEIVAKFKNDSERALEQMLVDQEISAFEITINPAQDVITSGNIVITGTIVPVGTARQITFNIGFATNL